MFRNFEPGERVLVQQHNGGYRTAHILAIQGSGRHSQFSVGYKSGERETVSYNFLKPTTRRSSITGDPSALLLCEISEVITIGCPS